MAEVSISTTPRFRGGDLWVAAGIGLGVVALVVYVLLDASNLFEATTTVATTPAAEPETADPVVTTATSTELATAKFVVAALVLVGSLLFVVGLVLALAEITRVESGTAAADDEAVAARQLVGGGTGASAVLLAIGELGKSLGDALKGLKTSAMFVLVGGVLLAAAAVVAWQTIPDVDGTTSIEITDPATTTTTAASDATTTTEADATTAGETSTTPTT